MPLEHDTDEVVQTDDNQIFEDYEDSKIDGLTGGMTGEDESEEEEAA